jgi:uncharacterized lipoprotein YmbA
MTVSERNAAEKKRRQREQIAATYRALWYACASAAPPGNYYDLPESDKGRWRDDGGAAAKSLGLIAEVAKKGSP